MSTYAQQHRGDLDAYARYLAAMDGSMRQKVALTAAHLPASGRVADMGMGSGAGSEALAGLYPGLEVVGVDVNPTMVELAGRQYQRPNLQFQQGDIARPCFPERSLDGIVNSSVLHHVTSYNGYDREQARQALTHQVPQLKEGGTLIVRDFLAPEPGPVELRLPPHWVECWRRFSREFRALLPPEQRGFVFEDGGVDEQGWQCLQVDHRLAVEFVLRKDYQDDWASEILEEYTYFTQTEFEAEFARLGLRVLLSTPLRNSWIIERRFRGQFELCSPQGEALDDPPTNYLIVGERVAEGQGVRFLPSTPTAPLGFLERACYRQHASGRLYDLVCRPHPTVDVLPYCRSQTGNLMVLVRHSFPRPIQCDLEATLDGFRPCGYSVEPITALQSDEPLGDTVEAMLRQRGGLPSSAILRMRVGSTHYPSPGGLREEVIACFAEIEPAQVDPSRPAAGLRLLDAHQLLRSAQVHGLPDHRLEMHVFSLMRHLSIDPGPWLGDQLDPVEGNLAPAVGNWELLPGRAFERVDPILSPGFLQVEARRYQEVDTRGRVVSEHVLESARPTRFSCQTLALLPMCWHQSQWWVGLDLDELPAAQAFSGNSTLWVAPAWRLPTEIAGLGEAQRWVAARLAEQSGEQVLEWAPLGGPYFPSPGLTPELVYPYAVRVQPGRLAYFPLHEAISRWESLLDGHLRGLLLRAYLAHRSS